jgi:hypothetical protein
MNVNVFIYSKCEGLFGGLKDTIRPLIINSSESAFSI